MESQEINHYQFRTYEHKGRFASYWHQIDETINTKPQNILIVGIGTNFLQIALNNYFPKIKIDTLDIDKSLNPSIEGSVTQIPVRDSSYDTVLCFQVLEHLNYEYFPQALSELYRVSRNNVILSIPDRTRAIIVRVNAYRLPLKNLNIILPLPIMKQKHALDDQHYWEIGWKAYPLREIKNQITHQGFKLHRTFRVPEKPIHRFFILSK